MSPFEAAIYVLKVALWLFLGIPPILFGGAMIALVSFAYPVFGVFLVVSCAALYLFIKAFKPLDK